MEDAAINSQGQSYITWVYRLMVYTLLLQLVPVLREALDINLIQVRGLVGSIVVNLSTKLSGSMALTGLVLLVVAGTNKATRNSQRFQLACAVYLAFVGIMLGILF